MKYIFTILIFCTISISTYSQTFSIVSWNISHFGKTKDASEIKRIAQIVRDFDIVAIQEVVAIDPAGAKAVAREQKDFSESHVLINIKKNRWTDYYQTS